MLLLVWDRTDAVPEESREVESLSVSKDPQAGNGEAKLIVVVDDQPSIIEGLAMLFESWGFEVLSALSLQQLEERLVTVKVRPSLVVADYYLPAGQTGAQAVEMVRQHVSDQVPAIILTGETRPEVQKEVEGQGYQLVYKPVQIAPLKKLVDSLIAS